MAPRHDWQSVATPPPHAVLQQTPSTQFALAQAAACVHAVPFASIGTKTYAAPCWAMESTWCSGAPTTARLPFTDTAVPKPSLAAPSLAVALFSCAHVVPLWAKK
jgi:hypothetical protein